jgi:hypothetical protein
MCFSGVNLTNFSKFLENFSKLSTYQNWNYLLKKNPSSWLTTAKPSHRIQLFCDTCSMLIVESGHKNIIRQILRKHIRFTSWWHSVKWTILRCKLIKSKFNCQETYPISVSCICCHVIFKLLLWKFSSNHSTQSS